MYNYEHTEKIRPPRALWVSFELGLPLGVPNNAGFQKKVLHSALKLLEAEKGPVLEAFKEDAPAAGTEESAKDDAWACPVSFSPSAKEETDLEKLISAFKQELSELRPWYDLGRQERGRTAVADFDSETAADILCKYLSGKNAEIPVQDMSQAVALRLAAQDLKAFYFEAVIPRPGARVPESREFADWYWNQTAAGFVLKNIQKKCLNEQDKELKMTGKIFLVPMAQ